MYSNECFTKGKLDRFKRYLDCTRTIYVLSKRYAEFMLLTPDSRHSADPRYFPGKARLNLRLSLDSWSARKGLHAGSGQVEVWSVASTPDPQF